MAKHVKTITSQLDPRQTESGALMLGLSYGRGIGLIEQHCGLSVFSLGLSNPLLPDDRCLTFVAPQRELLTYKAGVRDGLMLLIFMPTLAPSSFLVRLGLGILHQASASIIV